MDNLQALAMVVDSTSGSYAMTRVVERADQCLQSLPSEAAGGDPTVAVVFHIGGADFAGIRRSGFSKRDRIAGFDIAVPEPFPAGEEAAFVWAALARVLDIVDEIADARSLDWSVEHLRTALQSLHACLKLDAACPELSHWLGPRISQAPQTESRHEPQQHQTMLSIQLPTRSRAPSRADVVVRQRLEQVLEAALAQDSSGSVDGSDIGIGMMGIYVQVANEGAVTLVLNVLRSAGYLDSATIVLRRADPDVPEDDQYQVVWPKTYSALADPAELFAGFGRATREV